MGDKSETTYTKKLDNGQVVERTAYTPADHVELEFNGWRKKAETKSSPASAGDSKSTNR